MICRKFANPPLQMGGFKLGWGGLACFLLGVLLHKKSLGHPAKAQVVRCHRRYTQEVI